MLETRCNSTTTASNQNSPTPIMGIKTEHGTLPCTHSGALEKHGIIYKGNPSLLIITVAIQVAFVCKAL